MSFFRDRFRRAPVQSSLICLVLTMHLFFFATWLTGKNDETRKVNKQRIIVKTAQPKVSHPVTSSIPVAKTAKTSLPKPAPEKKKPVEKTAAIKPKKSPVPPPISKAVSSKKTSPTPKPTRTLKKKEKTVISDELVEQLQESIAKIEKKHDKYSPEEPFVLPEKITPFSKTKAAEDDQDSRAFLAGVKEELMQQLHLALHLPDYGEVKIQLELSETGKVQTIKVLKAASQKNREYLERELPRMTFSFLSMHRLSPKERTFVISFHNEM